MRALGLLFLSSMGLLLAVSPARADFIATASLSAATDNATNSNGSGYAWIDFNSTTDVFTYHLSWTNLTGDATMAHIHLGAPGVSGPIVVPFFMPPMPSLPANDSISGTLTNADVMPVNGVTTIAEVAQQILAGNAYVNIHTAQYPAGEIRGQLAMAPEPGAFGLMLGGLAGAAGLVWNRRRRAA